jgi:hypothetical protein
VDWRWTDGKRSGDWRSILRPRGLDLTTVLTRTPAGVEQPMGRWNRGVFRLRGNRLNVEVNGKSLGEGWEVRGLVAKGPTLVPAPPAPVQVANVFFKRLD